MPIFNSIKKALGFGINDYDEDDLDGIDARVTPRNQRPDIAENDSDNLDVTTTEPESHPESDQTETDKPDEAKVHLIFESVLKVFNESLPDFLKNSVDKEQQLKYLYECLDVSIKQYLEAQADDVRRRSQGRWDAERRKLIDQLNQLRKKVERDEEESSETKRQHLSAERQKRALSERVHDLEKQVATLEAENEQYQLENKTMMNKIRLNNVMSGGQSSPELENTLKELNDKIAALDAEKQALNAQIETLNQQNKTLSDSLQASKAKDDLGDAMLTDLNKRAATAREQAEALSAENETLKTEKAELETRLNEAETSLKIVDKIQQQIVNLEERRKTNEEAIKRQKDELDKKQNSIDNLNKSIEEYSTNLRSKDDRIRTLEDTIDSLRKTIENNLFEHANTERALREEVDRLKKEHTNPTAANRNNSADKRQHPANNPQPTSAKTNNPPRRPIKISAIDETLEDTDWLISTPPPQIGNQAEELDPEFGYREPERKPGNDNPAQMSLF